jgi:hypothetical protein
MTFAQIRPEIDDHTREDRDRLSAYLTMLQMEEDVDLENKQIQKLERSSDWVEVKVIGKYAIYYWADHAVKEIKVIDIFRSIH